MARPKRIDFSFTLYHVFSRTISEERAFQDSRDRNKFLQYCAKYVDLYDFRVHAFCLMPNHFHLLVESKGNPLLSHLLHRLLTAFTVYYNRRHGRQGHLFQGRFKSLVVEKSTYLLALSRYIHLNPVRAGLSSHPEEYKGSSFLYYCQGGEPDWLYTKEILLWFKGNRKSYTRFVVEGLDKETKPQILRQRYVGGEEFVQRMQCRLERMTRLGPVAEKSARQGGERLKDAERKMAEEISNVVAKHFRFSSDIIRNAVHARGDLGKARRILIYLLRENLPWNIKDIAQYVGLKQLRGVQYHLEKMRVDKELKDICHSIKKRKQRRS